ncbi:MAG: VCBS repeat-containing protein, partial [Myxococcales bacterium]|nr:VCBS repeat-containing protein [Myxococcales bacterium]
DLNGDGAVDLAMANVEPFNIEDADASVLLGEGDGTFFGRLTTIFDTDFFFVMTEFFAVGDFDEDGNADLVIPISGTFDGDGLRFLRGNGDGTFATTFTTIPTSFIPDRAYPADFDGDQTLDLLIVKENEVFDDAQAAVLLGDGDGTFTAAPALTHGVTNLTAAGVADFNNDDVPDILLLEFQNPPGQVLLGNGNGTFGAPIELGQFFFSNAVDVRFGDADGDGNTDLFLRGGPTAFRGGIHFGAGDGTFDRTLSFDAIALPSIYSGMTVGDFNNDGFDDVAYGSSASTLSDAFGEITVILSNGAGTFDPFISVPVGESAQHLGTVDANGDGVDDIVGANVYSNDVSLLVSNGDGTFQAQRRFGVDANPRALQTADVTGDGLPDLSVPDGRTSGVGVLPRR